MKLFPVKSKSAATAGREYWRSLDQLADTPSFREWVSREFPAHADEMLDASSRRTVLKLMAASFGLAGLTACRRPVEKILPASKGIEDYVPGQPYFYSSVFSLGGDAMGVLVEAHDGRPTKIEGNPDHPRSLGAATAMAQASVLSVYDPDRSKMVFENGSPSSWDAFEKFWKQQALGQGEGLRFLSPVVQAPSYEAVRTAALAKYPKAKWVEYEPISNDNARAGAQLAFGEALDAHPQFDKADVILALDCDFLGLDAPTVLPTKQFSRGRHVTEERKEMNRLYAVEAQFSITGAMADHRLRMKAGEVLAFATDLAREMGALPGGGLHVVASQADRRQKFLRALAKDLKARGSKALVVAGPRQPAAVHAVAHLINQVLGANGSAVTFTKAAGANSGIAALKELSDEMASGQVKTLVVLGGNPVYTAPVDFAFGDNLGKVPVSVHLGLEVDETASAAKWHLPEAHYLESWGDARGADGTCSIQQPLIEPLYGGRTPAEVLALMTGYKDQRPYDIVRNYWLEQWPAESREKTWRESLYNGVVAGARSPEVKPNLDAKRIQATLEAGPKATPSGIEVALYPSSASWDGRFSNNGWMQEAPDPMTKLVWGNAALMSLTTAKILSVTDGDVVTITRGGMRLDAAVLIAPGHADQTIGIALGYGRTKCGPVGKDVGFNAYLLRKSDQPWFADGCSVSKTGRRHMHATTQEHGTMDGRPLVREAAIEEYRKSPKVIEEKVELPVLTSIYHDRRYDTGNQWGMAIDLNACTGCNACVVACQAENNIPIVGKDQVLRGREMHWLRMDRYYTGSPDEPQAVMQALPCQQCENAPCENVCPVAATTHSPEGLNDMAYNRCVGTRYCANNCPFKVRHFNFLNFHKHDEEVEKMTFNPDVTVRMRGVMEKCTYCVQRIQEAKIKAKTEGHRPLKDGEIVTACQQTCPAEAIVFGNINDASSRVAKLKKEERNYAMLAELNLKPRTTYLAKLRNPNPELGEA